MSLPFTPNDAKALIPDPTSTLCGNFLSALLKLPVLFYQFINWAFDSTGNPTKALINSALPTGSYIFSAVILAEDGTKLLCDGRQTISQATFPTLFIALGTTYGPAAGGGFTIPDCRARFPVGVGNFAAAGACVAGTAVGADRVTLLQANHATHKHPGSSQFQTPVERGAADTMVLATINHGDGSITLQDTGNEGSSTPFDIIPPGFPCYVYIVC